MIPSDVQGFIPTNRVCLLLKNKNKNKKKKRKNIAFVIVLYSSYPQKRISNSNLNIKKEKENLMNGHDGIPVWKTRREFAFCKTRLGGAARRTCTAQPHT